MATADFATILREAQHLSPEEQRRLRDELTRMIDQPPIRRRRSSYGALAHLGTAPSAEEIDEVRREIWANFPREDIA